MLLIGYISAIEENEEIYHQTSSNIIDLSTIVFTATMFYLLHILIEDKPETSYNIYDVAPLFILCLVFVFCIVLCIPYLFKL